MNELLIKIGEQIYLVIISVSVAILIGIPLAVVITRCKKLEKFTLGFIGVLQTIPSLAMLAFFIPLFGIGVVPALIALSIYSLLPIVRNAYIGILNVPSDMIEAANGMGLTSWQRLRLVEIPLAMPTIIAGVRTAAILSVGVATLAAFVGAGGLGDFINRGLAVNDNHLILMGAIPAAILALSLDGLIGAFEKWIKPGASKQGSKKNKLLIFASSFLFVVGLFGWFVISEVKYNSGKVVVVGSKNFSEQYLLADMIAILIKENTDLKVQKKLNLGATSLIHQALVRGDIDLYPEYTGTAYSGILHAKQKKGARQIYYSVKKFYQKKYDLLWLKPLGFENKAALAVTRKSANQYGLRNISDLPKVPRLSIGAPAEFVERPDSYLSLVNTYGLKFDEINQMDPGLAYEALANNKVNVIMAFSTDGRVKKFNLVLLDDNRNGFPAYQAAIVVRNQTLKKYPELNSELNKLSGNISDEDIMELNYETDVLGRSHKDVAREFLLKKGLI